MKENDIRPDSLKKDQEYFNNQDIAFMISELSNFEEINCPACQTINESIKFKKNLISYKECCSCGMLYVSPRPSFTTLKEFYSQSPVYKYFNDYIFPASKEKRREKIFIPRVNKILDIIDKYDLKTNSMLEIGAGFGIFCEELSKKNIFTNIKATEASDSLYHSCKNNNIEVFNGIFEDLVINEKFDLIVSFEVIEHVSNPYIFLKKAYDNLQKGGFLYLTFPNYNGFDIGITGKDSRSIDHEHLNYFNENAIKILSERIGYTTVEVETPGLLDIEIVRNDILNGSYTPDPFIKYLCVDKYKEIGEKFQQFLIENKLSSNMSVLLTK